MLAGRAAPPQFDFSFNVSSATLPSCWSDGVREVMAKTTNEGARVGAVRDRVQVLNPVTQHWVKLDTKTGKIIDQKKTYGPYKGIRKK